MRRVLAVVGRVMLGAVFLYASVDKVWDPAGFAQAVARYDLLPIWIVGPVSVGLAWSELAVGILLVVGVWVDAAAVLAAGMLGVFTALMLWAGFTGAGYDCGCFPGQVGSHPAGFEAAARDGVLLALAVWVWWNYRRG